MRGRATAIISALRLLVVTVAISLPAAAEQPRFAAGATAPHFQASPIEGGTGFGLSQLRGKVVLLNFWASWCAPCRFEMPLFQSLYDRLGDKGFEVVAIATMDNRDVALAFHRQHRFSYRVLFDKGDAVAGIYGITGPPQTFLIGRDGKLIPIPDPTNGQTRVVVNNPRIWEHPATADFLEGVLARK